MNIIVSKGKHGCHTGCLIPIYAQYLRGIAVMDCSVVLVTEPLLDFLQLPSTATNRQQLSVCAGMGGLGMALQTKYACQMTYCGKSLESEMLVLQMAAQLQLSTTATHSREYGMPLLAETTRADQRVYAGRAAAV